MGFGKWVLGGVCAAGAVIAAPVVLPAAGLAIVGSSLGATGVGLTAGLGMMAASSGAVATTAAVAGTAGVAIGAAQEKKIDNARHEGKEEGIKEASQEYEEKFRKQAEIVEKLIKEFESADSISEEQRIRMRDLIEELMLQIEELERKLEKAKRENSSNTNEITNQIAISKNWMNRLNALTVS